MSRFQSSPLIATNENRKQQTACCARKVCSLSLKRVQIHDGAIVLFANENVYRFIQKGKAFCLVWIFQHLPKLLLTMQAENRTSAAEHCVLQYITAYGAGLAALPVNAQIGRIAVVFAFAN